MCTCAHSDSNIVQLALDYRSFLLLISHGGSLNLAGSSLQRAIYPTIGMVSSFLQVTVV